MKTAVIASIAALAAAQDATVTKNVAVADGAGVNALATSTAAVALAIIPEVSGTVVASQTVSYPAPKSNNIVQSWITFEGASDSGNNVYSFANGTYGSNTASPAQTSTAKVCGAAPASMSPPGANTVRSSLRESPCSLALVQDFKQSGTDFAHTVSIALVPAATTGSLVLGESASVTAGWNVYLNPASTAAIVDSYSGSSASFTLDGALALTLSGAAAAVAALAF